MFSYNKSTGTMDYFGPLINLAARVCASAAPGQVMGDEKTKEALGEAGSSQFDPSSVGQKELKGIKGACELFCAPTEEQPGDSGGGVEGGGGVGEGGGGEGVGGFGEGGGSNIRGKGDSEGSPTHSRRAVAETCMGQRLEARVGGSFQES